MAFRIESIEKMKNIASKTQDCANLAESQSSKAISAIEQINSSVSGPGLTTSLQTLKDSITANTKAVVRLLEDISFFISTQTTSYAENEETSAASLDSVQTELDSLLASMNV